MRATLATLVAALGWMAPSYGNEAPEPPFRYVWGHAYHVLPGTHNEESGYFSLCEGNDGKLYVGTALYGKNSFLVEFDPRTGAQRIVIDTNKVCGLEPRSWNESQSKIHTRNFVGPSGKVYVGSMEAHTRKTDPTAYPGGYVMTFDPATDRAECLGRPLDGQGVIDVVADEPRGLLYVVPIDAERSWMLYNTKTGKYRELGPIPTIFGTTLIDKRGRANTITRDFEIARYDPRSTRITVRPLVADGKKMEPGDPGTWVPYWILAPDGRTAYLLQMTDPTLYAIDLLAKGDTVPARNLGRMLEGKNHDSRCALSMGPDGNVYMVIRRDNTTGFGRYWLHHLVRFRPSTGKPEDLGVLAVKNPLFFFTSPGAEHEHPALSKDEPPYYGYHTLPDGTLTPKYNHLAMIVARDGAVWVTILYPFTLLKIPGIAS